MELSENNITKYICQADNCNRMYNDKSGAIRHLRKNHKNVYNAVKLNKNKISTEESLGSAVEIRVKVDPAEIWDACVELVTANGLPWSIPLFNEF